MIDEEKIQEAAYDMNDGELTNDKLMRGGFVCGAQWAQAEFVNSLWHNEDEIPKDGKFILVRYCDEERLGYEAFNTATEFDNLSDFDAKEQWEVFCENAVCSFSWCYISDILPKKGGEK